MIKSILPTAAKILTTLFTSSAIVAPIALKYVPKTQETSEVTPTPTIADTPSTEKAPEATVEDRVNEETSSQTKQKENFEEDSIVRVEKSKDKKIAVGQESKYEEVKKKLEEYVTKFKDYEEYMSLKNLANSPIKNCLKKIEWDSLDIVDEIRIGLETYEKIKVAKKKLDDSTEVNKDLLDEVDKIYETNLSEHVTSDDYESENSSEQKTIEELIKQYKLTKDNLNKCINESLSSR